MQIMHIDFVSVSWWNETVGPLAMYYPKMFYRGLFYLCMFGVESFYNEIMNFGAMFSSKNRYMINPVRHATVLTLI